ncbi:hypothetical protein CRUP_032503, partial [Coryphaenoides rupestris]
DPAAEEWSQWSVCSLTCGQGWQVRTRSCVSSPYGTLCSGALRETRMCNNTAACPGDPGIISPDLSTYLFSDPRVSIPGDREEFPSLSERPRSLGGISQQTGSVSQIGTSPQGTPDTFNGTAED